MYNYPYYIAFRLVYRGQILSETACDILECVEDNKGNVSLINTFEFQLSNELDFLPSEGTLLVIANPMNSTMYHYVMYYVYSQKDTLSIECEDNKEGEEEDSDMEIECDNNSRKRKSRPQNKDTGKITKRTMNFQDQISCQPGCLGANVQRTNDLEGKTLFTFNIQVDLNELRRRFEINPST